jgi:hypothetical protein
MLRWVIAFLLIANLAAFAAVSGAFGPIPSAGDLEPGHVSSQVHPEHLDVQLASADPTPAPVVGAPVDASAPESASLPAAGVPASGAMEPSASAPAATSAAAAPAASAAASASAPAATAPNAPSSAAK